MSVDRRRALVEPAHHRLSIAAQCRLLRISRSSYYYGAAIWMRSFRQSG